jgi:hypothetical protein
MNLAVCGGRVYFITVIKPGPGQKSLRKSTQRKLLLTKISKNKFKRRVGLIQLEMIKSE